MPTISEMHQGKKIPAEIISFYHFGTIIGIAISQISTSPIWMHKEFYCFGTSPGHPSILFGFLWSLLIIFCQYYYEIRDNCQTLILEQEIDFIFTLSKKNKNKRNKTWSSVSNSTSVLPFIPYPLTPTPCSLSPRTVPFMKFRWGLSFLSFSLSFLWLSPAKVKSTHSPRPKTGVWQY